MTKIQQKKRFVLTLILSEIIVVIITASILSILFYSDWTKKVAEIEKNESKLTELVKREAEAKKYINKYESSSDLKKKNTIIISNIKPKAIEFFNRISNVNPYLNLQYMDIIESNEYLNVIDVKFKTTLKESGLDRLFLKEYTNILKTMFESNIKSNNFYNLRQISDDVFIVTYKSDVEGAK